MVRETERIRLTLDRIRKLTPPTGTQAVYVFDDDPKQLCVRVTPAGVKSFVFAGKLNRVPLRVTIGDVKVWNLDDARTEARRLQGLIDQGTDPRLERADRIAATEAKREKARRLEAPALEAWGAYIEARKAMWSERHLADHESVAKEGARCAPEAAGRGRVTRPCPEPSGRCCCFPSPGSMPIACVCGLLMKPHAVRPMHALPMACCVPS